jgi:hypothetical protein
MGTTTRMRADSEVVEKMRESHRGMVDGCRWNEGGMGYSRPVVIKKE